MSVSTKSSSALTSCDTCSNNWVRRARRVGADERVDVRVAANRLQHLVQVPGHRGEALLVIRFADKPGDGDVVPGGARRRRQQEGRQGHPNHHLHTTPHFRRTSHSANRSSTIASRNTGMFHSSLVSRVVTPASENAISSGRSDRSCGRQYLPPVCEARRVSRSRFWSV